MTWHIVDDQIDAYLDRRVDTTTAASVEAHLLSCPDCRARLAERTPAAVVSASWQSVERRIDAEPVGATARALSSLGVDERYQRLLAPTVPLRLAWLAATALATVSGALLVRDLPDASIGVLVYLTLAAVVPLAAVASSLSTVSDPAAEVGVAAPLASVQVTGFRATAVLVATATITLAAGILLPGPWTETSIWLLPSLAMCALTTTLSGRLGPMRAASVVGTLWIGGIVVWVAATHDRLAPFRTGPQLAYLALAALGVAVVLRRPDLLEPAPAVPTSHPRRSV